MSYPIGVTLINESGLGLGTENFETMEDAKEYIKDYLIHTLCIGDSIKITRND